MQLFTWFRAARGSAAWNSLLVMAGFILSRLSGLLRDVIISAQFATSAEYGAYLAAFRITDLLYIVIVGGALGSSLIPVFIQAWEHDGAETAWRVASAVLTWALLILALASGVIMLFAPQITRLLYGGGAFNADELALISALTRFFLLSPLLLGVGGLAMAVLNARERFALPALAPSLYNLGQIGGALWLAPWLGIWGLAWGVVIGALLLLLVQIPGLVRLGMALRLELGRGLEAVRTVGEQMGPRVLGQSAAHLSHIITATIAVRLVDGPALLGGLNYAYQMMLLPYGVIALSLSTVAYPRLARLHAEGRQGELARDVRATLGTILFLSLPAMAALLAFGAPLVRLVLQRGAFDNSSLAITSLALSGYALALPAFAASEILIRAFYAMQRPWPPVVLGIGQMALNFALATLLSNAGWGVLGLALAFSAANTLEALLLTLWLRRHLAEFRNEAQFQRNLLAGLLGSLAIGGLWWAANRWGVARFSFLDPAAAYAWQRETFGLLLWLLLVGGLGAALYLAIAAGLRAPAIAWVRARLRRSG